jgi:hypothetical protein
MAFTTIDDPSLHFRIKAYTGNGTNDTAYTWDETHANMQPDWLWFKNRDESQSNAAFDSVRGATLRLIPNETGAEGTENSNLDSFDSNGFTVDNELIVNGSSDNMIVWGWKGGGSASSNSDGDITSSISANTTAGFSIVSYTGSGTIGNTVGHGLGAIPAWIITKNRDATSQWITWHQGGTSTKNMDLSTNDAEYDSSSSGWQQGINNVPTSSLLRFTAGSHGNNNVMDSSEKYISYVFVEKQGYSSFGKYEGNGNANGPFVYTGFRPAWVMIKRTDSSADWHIQDNKRDTFNAVDTSLFSNTYDTDTTSSSYDTDFLSNGFKLRGTTTARNGSGNTYIYIAFAESPFVNSNGVPCNAR